MTPPKLSIDPLAKGLGALAADGSAQPWQLLAGEVALPAAVLREARLAHNLRWMQRFIDAYGLKLAPHGKTTMAPALFHRQIAAGAWGITVATAQQAQVAVVHGIQRVLIANQLIGKANIAMVTDLLADPAVEIVCLVDSPESVLALGDVLAPRGLSLQVLLELAPTASQGGYRTGIRTAEQQLATLTAIARSDGHVRLAGVEIYEGVLSDENEIRAYLRRAVITLSEIIHAGAVKRTAAILSGAGSAWYDVVAEEFAAAAHIDSPVDIVLRPGCYLSHDTGLYRLAQERILSRNPIAADMHGGLLPALQIWAYVQSIPSKERAVIAMGKRDAAFDAGLPQPTHYHRQSRDDHPIAVPAHWQITGMMDQHAFMAIAADDDIQVGDMIAFDISHPCLTFDRWRHLLLVDEDYRCIDVIATYF